VISSAEAVLLLKGLKDKLAPVRVNLVTADARCAFDGLISEISDSEVILTVPFKVSCAMLVNLERARFDYGDTREAPASIRESLSEKFISALTILLQNGTHVVITEMNPAGR
jgi:hypothetical protein